MDLFPLRDVAPGLWRDAQRTPRSSRTVAVTPMALLQLMIGLLLLAPAAPVVQSDAPQRVDVDPITKESWMLRGAKPEHYKGDVLESKDLGRVSAYLESRRRTRSFATFMMRIDATSLRGKRIRLSADVSSTEIRGRVRNGLRFRPAWGGMWMRVDRGDEVIAFDNMAGRGLRGTTEPRRRSVVLDVAEDATTISYGLILGGHGEVKASDVRLEIVGEGVPVTDLETGRAKPS